MLLLTIFNNYILLLKVFCYNFVVIFQYYKKYYVIGMNEDELFVESLLKEKGLSKTDLAELMGVHKQNINRLLKNPTFETLKRIAVALKVPIVTLFANPLSSTAINCIDDFVAMARFRGEYFHADSIDELEKQIQIWKEQTIQERKK